MTTLTLRQLRDQIDNALNDPQHPADPDQPIYHIGVDDDVSCCGQMFYFRSNNQWHIFQKGNPLDG